MNTMFTTLLAAAVKVETPINGQTGVWIKSGVTVISSGMKMTGATITSGKIQYVYDHGLVRDTLVASQGHQFVSRGGTALGTVLSGGTQTVYLGGAVNSTAVYSSGRLAAIGGNVTNVSLAGYFSFLTASNAYVSGVSNSNLAYIYAYGGGVIENITLTSAGSVFVSSGGTVSGVALSGGRLTVSSGGTALAVTSTGGTVTVMDGGYIEYA